MGIEFILVFIGIPAAIVGVIAIIIALHAHFTQVPGDCLLDSEREEWQ